MPGQSAGEMELERLVVRIMGDAKQYINTLKESEAQSKKFGDTQEKEGKRVVSAHGKMGLSMRDTRHGLHLLAMTGVVPHEGLGNLMGLVYGFHLAEKGALTLVKNMFTLRGALIATGVGAAAAGAGVLIFAVTRLSEEAEKAGKSAKKAFDEFVSGAKGASEAATGVRIDVLKDHLETVALRAKEIAATRRHFEDPSLAGFIASGIRGWQAAFGQRLHAEPMEDVYKRQAEGIKILQEMIRETSPAIKELREQEKLLIVQETMGPQWERTRRKNIEALKLEAITARMTADEQKAHAEANRLANRYLDAGGTAAASWATAVRDAASATEELRSVITGMGWDKATKDIRDQIDALKDEGDRLGLTADEAKVLADAQKIARDRHVELTEVYKKLGPELKKMYDETRRISGGKVWEEVRTPLEKYAERIDDLRDLLNHGKISQETYERAVLKANAALDKGSASFAKYDAAAWGSVEALSRIAEFQFGLREMGRSPEERGIGMVQRFQAAPAGGVEAASRAADQKQILIEIRNAIREGNKRPPVFSLPANIGGSSGGIASGLGGGGY